MIYWDSFWCFYFSAAFDNIVVIVVVFFLGACKMMVGCKVLGGGSGSDSQRKL